MTTALRAIETEQYRLVHYRLDSGDEYFAVSQDPAPEVLRTSIQEVNLTSHSTIDGYKTVESAMVFLNTKPAGLTVVQEDRTNTPKVYLFKNRSEQEVLPSTPLPLVASTTPTSTIQLLTDQIRLVTSRRRIISLNDFAYVADALNSAVTKTAEEADQAVRIADESMSFLLHTLHTLPDSSEYDVFRQTTLEQMRIKLEDYNLLTTLVDKLLDHRQEIEQLTRKLQESVKPITQISQRMTLQQMI